MLLRYIFSVAAQSKADASLRITLSSIMKRKKKHNGTPYSADFSGLI
jgi:hypothetical protein